MKRSVCSCLVSLAFIASAHSANAQVLLGHTRLAPVALEARCQVADGMLGSWTQLTSLGADPLHAAVLLADQGIEMPRCDQTSSEESLAECDTSVRSDDHSSSIATVESAESGPRDEMSQGCIGSGFIAPDDESNASWVENPCPQESYCCPLADLAADEPIDVNRYDETPVADAASTASMELSEERQVTEVAARANLIGSSPMIFLLQEEYLPYDLDRKFPVEIGFFPIKGPTAYPIDYRQSLGELEVVYGPEPMTSVVADSLAPREGDSVAASEGSSVEEAIDDGTAESLDLPIACYIDLGVNYALDLADANGPVMPFLDARLLGQFVGPLPYEAVNAVIRWTKPAWPILMAPASAPLPQIAPQPAPQNIAPLGPGLNPELEVAASTLHYAASGLERFAGALRGLGDSLSRVASGDQGLRR